MLNVVSPMFSFSQISCPEYPWSSGKQRYVLGCAVGCRIATRSFYYPISISLPQPSKVREANSLSTYATMSSFRHYQDRGREAWRACWEDPARPECRRLIDRFKISIKISSNSDPIAVIKQECIIISRVANRTRQRPAEEIQAHYLHQLIIHIVGSGLDEKKGLR